MKKLCLILSLVLITAYFTGCKDSNKVINADNAAVITIYADFVDYDYNSIKDNAEIIAHVKITDELTNQNSNCSYDGVNIVSFSSVRNAYILEVYKNSTGKDLGSTIQITETAAVSNDGKLYVTNGDTPLKKGNEYIVFLNSTTSGDGYCVMSAATGKINITDDVSLNKNHEIAYKTLLEFACDTDNELKQQLLNATAINEVYEYAEYLTPVVITTKFGNITVVEAKTENADYRVFEVNNDLWVKA